MEKLELKHIVGYLPYDLLLASPKNKMGFHNKMILRGRHLTDVGLFEEAYKPILRPLSDLTKEIEVNLEKFVPIDNLREWFTNIYFEIGIYGKLHLKAKNENFINNEYCQIITSYLYEWHFDIHNLIEKGLAIDINTLK